MLKTGNITKIDFFLLVLLKDFDRKYRTAANSRKAFWRKVFFAEHFALTFYLSNHLQYFNSILTSYCTASVWHCVLFLLTLKKTHLAIYVCICLPRNSTCVVKRKQTWPEQAAYSDEGLSSHFETLYCIYLSVYNPWI